MVGESQNADFSAWFIDNMSDSRAYPHETKTVSLSSTTSLFAKSRLMPNYRVINVSKRGDNIINHVLDIGQLKGLSAIR